MRMLSLKQWAKKVESLATKIGVPVRYINAEISCKNHIHINLRIFVYNCYFDCLSGSEGGAHTESIDWKEVLEAAEIKLRKYMVNNHQPKTIEP